MSHSSAALSQRLLCGMFPGRSICLTLCDRFFCYWQIGLSPNGVDSGLFAFSHVDQIILQNR